MNRKIEICTMSRTPVGSLPWTKKDKHFDYEYKTIGKPTLVESYPGLSTHSILHMISLFAPSPDGRNPPISDASYTDVEEVIYNLCNIADGIDKKWHMTQVTFVCPDELDFRVLKLYRLYPNATIRLEIGVSVNVEHEILLADTFTSKHMALLLQHRKLASRRKLWKKDEL